MSTVERARAALAPSPHRWRAWLSPPAADGSARTPPSFPARMVLATALLAGVTGTVLVSITVRRSPPSPLTGTAAPALTRMGRSDSVPGTSIPPRMNITPLLPIVVEAREAATPPITPMGSAAARSNWLALRADSRPLRRARSIDAKSAPQRVPRPPKVSPRPTAADREASLLAPPPARPNVRRDDGPEPMDVLDGRK